MVGKKEIKLNDYILFKQEDKNVSCLGLLLPSKQSSSCPLHFIEEVA